MNYFHVDSFATQPFEGNPAGMCLLDEPADAEWMQRIAADVNLSETALVNGKANGFDLRWLRARNAGGRPCLVGDPASIVGQRDSLRHAQRRAHLSAARDS